MSLAAKFNRRKKDTTKAANQPQKRPSNKHVNTVEKILKNIENFIADQNLPEADIKEVSFSVFDKEVAKRNSVCKITNVNSNIDPTGSLDDPRMGTIENYQLCTTCEKTNDECTGHMSILELSANFIHPFFRSTVVQVLNCICHTCNKLLITDIIIQDKGIDTLKGGRKLKAISDICLKLECSNPACAARPFFKDKKPSETNIYDRSLPFIIKKGKQEKDSFMSVNTIKKKLDYISDKDAKTLGFTINHPRNFIIDYIPIIPLNDRPYNTVDNIGQKDHPITMAYKEILLKNLESMQYENEDKQEECYQTILKYYSLLIKNNSKEFTISQKEPLKSITDLITRKDGLIRGHMMGKRCDYTGRTVLGSNERLNFGYLALPEEMKNLTIPEIITIYNYEHIIELARQGRIKFFCPKEGNLAGRKLKFDISKHLDKLDIGDRIDRFSQNGDYFLFNRQPTLHRQSMLGYEAQFQDKLSIGLHLSSTSGHNADFDGDEGNLHLVQTTEAQTEVRLIMSSTYCIINSGQSRPEASLIYNSITGAYLMTKDNDTITPRRYQEGIDYVTNRMVSSYVKDNMDTLESRLDGIDKYSNFGLVSILFPPDFWFMKGGILIHNGVLRRGNISSVCGSSYNGIIQVMVKKYGNKMAGYFISAANFLFNWFIFLQGFSLSIKDIMIEPKKRRDDFLEKRDQLINVMNVELTNMKEMENKINKYKQAEREEKITKLIYDTTEEVDKFFKENILVEEKNNSINIMSKSGAKGGGKKLYNVISSIGQIFIKGQLPAKKMSNGKRWISSFSVEDQTAYATGYSKYCYFEGIEPDSYFAAAQDGRLTLADTAIKTGEVGYLQRKMVKAQEDLILNYDGSVRNQSGIIFQFSYGAGFNPMKMVLDNSENDFEVYSFINLKQMCGEVNNRNGFPDFNISGKISSLINNINSRYGFQEEEQEEQEEEEFNDDKIFVEEDYQEFDA